MYYYIKGTLIKKAENFVVVDCGGVGYMINTSLTSISTLGAAGSEVTMYTYLVVREDAMELCGFASIEEKELFLKLISVSGVGPKAAMSILSVGSPSQIAAAIITNDTKTITKAQGVGPKVAQRVILELKDKIDNSELDISTDTVVVQANDTRTEAINALIVLGYSPEAATKAVAKTEAGLSVEEIIKKALILLM